MRRPPLTDARVAELAHQLREERRLVGSIRHIGAIVADFYGLPEEELVRAGARGTEERTEARYMALWIAAERHPRTSLTRLGRIVGYTDRTSAAHALSRMEELLAADEHLRGVLGELRVLAAA